MTGSRANPTSFQRSCALLAALFVALVSSLCETNAWADDGEALKTALAQPLLPPGTTLKETKRFIESRIIAPPSATDRAAWEKDAARFRRDLLEQIVFRGPAAARWRDASCQVQWLDTIPGGPGYTIQKFRYEALPGMWIPGLLYRPEKQSPRMPLAVHVNGHAPEGKAVDYKQIRSINLAKRGMLVLNLEWFGMGQLRTPGFSHYQMNSLDLCGASGLAPFYLAMSRAIDLGLKLDNVDPKRVAVSGLSGGGWQTIVISGLDERVTLANPVAGYGSLRTNVLFDDLGDSEQAPSDMGIVGDYAHLTAMRAPRPTLLTYNAGDDCCFKSGHTLEPLLAAARPIFALYGAEDKLRSHVNHVPGTHNFERENREQLYALIGDFFYPGDTSYPRAEISCADEVKTAEELHLPLPEANVDFQRLALSLLPGLPNSPEQPRERQAAERWQREQREKLRAVLKVPSYEATASEERSSAAGEYQMTSRLIKLGESWTMPAVEIAGKQASSTAKIALLIADGGRAGMSVEIQRLLQAHDRVLVVDPLLWGETKPKGQDPDFLFALLIAAVGERPLGIQAAQLMGTARLLRAAYPKETITLVAHGPRASMAALVAMALEPEAIAGAELHGSLGSLKELIETGKTVETLPELFAFGLLKEFDIPQIAALSAPRPVRFVDPSGKESVRAR